MAAVEVDGRREIRVVGHGLFGRVDVAAATRVGAGRAAPVPRNVGLVDRNRSRIAARDAISVSGHSDFFSGESLSAAITRQPMPSSAPTT
jgi:hypothetical protein